MQPRPRRRPAVNVADRIVRRDPVMNGIARSPHVRLD
jgi:hypothetical protein